MNTFRSFFNEVEMSIFASKSNQTELMGLIV